MLNLKPLKDNVLIKLVEETQTASGLVLPETENPTILKGEVLEIGAKVETVKINDGILTLNDHNVQRFDNKTAIISEKHILGIITE